MKKLKLFSILVCCLAALSFMSCNSSNTPSWTPLTSAQKASCFTQVTGSHTGKMIYVSDEHKTSTSDVSDTTSVNWNIGSGVGTDTTLTVTNFPIKVLAKYIPEEKVSKALASYEIPTSFKSAIYFHQITPTPAFLIKPEVVKCNVNYDGADHVISLYFYQSSVYSITSYGFYNSAQKALNMNILFGGYKIDAKDNDTSTPKPLTVKVDGRTYQYAPLTFIEQK